MEVYDFQGRMISTGNRKPWALCDVLKDENKGLR